MDAHYATIDEPATPEYVLSVLRDMHRQQCQCDPEADPDVSLSFDSTVADWRDACDLLGWRELSRAHNEFWHFACSDAEWLDALEPEGEKRLQGVCELIARHARRPAVRPARLLGCACDSAGAFLTVKSLLREAGAYVDDISPSTPLAPYTREFYEVFYGPISMLAPGALPLVRVRTPVYNAAIWAELAGMVCFVAGMITRLPPLIAVGAIVMVLAYGMIPYAARELPSSVEFGELRTFGDLARALAKGIASPVMTAPDGRM